MNTPRDNCLERFQRLFNQMSAHQLGELEAVYDRDVAFTDPFVTLYGLDALGDYFTGAYANVIECRFEFDGAVDTGDQVALPWIMTLRHKRIRRGEPVQVQGISHLKLGGDRILYHRDYFDAGQLLYENLPLLGSAVRWIRKYAA
ncbi:nuclear transport factor 2 family protein [Marinobacter sp. JSM 1782161]|uniref:nuclear transport factor 2 family protein n=1 Tax=Marinobacter sp. JSM 1782161 TaxID=2685906 RepID=UPI001401EAB8|nr:nuclear transport factor 2 family protein [Marinobacter sp. JSM 1782161]